MRISDWSSDVCSSDLQAGDRQGSDLRAGHDQLQPEAVVELNDLVDVVGIKFLERLIHQQKSRLWRRIPAAAQMIEIGRCGRHAEADIERDEFLSAACLATTLLEIGDPPIALEIGRAQV